MARTSITIALELDETEGSPSGYAHLPDGRRRTLHGWLGLAGAIDVLPGMSTRTAATTVAPWCAELDPRPEQQHEGKSS